jgi:TRAP-type mannitol/chloroaromatic compound transport system permease small subunit
MFLKLEKGPGFCSHIENFMVRVGKALAWLNIVLIANIIIQVVLRYGFGHGSVVLEETQWHLYGICIMFAIPYALVEDSHIRLDVAARKFSDKTKRTIEFFGILLLLFPMVTVLLLHSLDFAYESWRVNESSESPMGLPWRWAIKSVIPLSMFLLWLVSATRLIKVAVSIFKKGPTRGSHGPQ